MSGSFEIMPGRVLAGECVCECVYVVLVLASCVKKSEVVVAACKCFCGEDRGPCAR